MTPSLKLRPTSMLGTGAPRDLDAAAADVDDDGHLARQADAVHGRLMNEARFFGAGDHARADAGLVGDRLEEFAAVLRFARGAGRDGDDFVHAVRIGEPAELRQHLQRGVHRFGRQGAAVEPARAEPDHFLFAVDDFERQVGTHLHDDHVQRIGADIDGGDTHRSFLL